MASAIDNDAPDAPDTILVITFTPRAEAGCLQKAHTVTFCDIDGTTTRYAREYVSRQRSDYAMGPLNPLVIRGLFSLVPVTLRPLFRPVKNTMLEISRNIAGALSKVGHCKMDILTRATMTMRHVLDENGCVVINRNGTAEVAQRGDGQKLSGLILESHAFDVDLQVFEGSDPTIEFMGEPLYRVE